MMKPHGGQRITASFLSAPTEVKTFEPCAGYYLVEMAFEDGRESCRSLSISQDQLAQIEVLDRSAMAPGDGIDARRCFLFGRGAPHPPSLPVPPAAHRAHLPGRFPVSSDRGGLPLALESSRIRSLIADDAGAGTTIMAVLIFKELEYRKLVKLVLVVAPGHLKHQWQREMKERFLESFAVVDRSRMESAWGENVWEERDRCITSIDFAK